MNVEGVGAAWAMHHSSPTISRTTAEDRPRRPPTKLIVPGGWDDQRKGNLMTTDQLDGVGRARATDPHTSHIAAGFMRSKATSARVKLLAAHEHFPEGLTDEEAADAAGLSLLSEYATRCSELTRIGALTPTREVRNGRARVPRMVRTITPKGRALMDKRRRLGAS